MKKNIFSLCLVVVTLLITFMCSTTFAIGNIITIGQPSATPIPGMDAANWIGTLKWIGYIVAIGMIIWCGVKYVMAGAGEKAKSKETLIPILIGTVLVVAGIEITAAVFNALGS